MTRQSIVTSAVVASLFLLAGGLATSSVAHADDDWEDYWEDYEDAREDYYEGLREYQRRADRYYRYHPEIYFRSGPRYYYYGDMYHSPRGRFGRSYRPYYYHWR